MAALEAHGIAVELPEGSKAASSYGRPLTGVAYPVAQFATFPLPAEVGDFGGGAVDLMGPGDVFATLFEYGPESIGTRLFARQGRPTSLGANDFSPMTLRRGLPGQSGTQRFFTESGPAVLVLCGTGQPRVAQLARPEGQRDPRLLDAPAAGAGHVTSGADMELIGPLLDRGVVARAARESPRRSARATPLGPWPPVAPWAPPPRPGSCASAPSERSSSD